MILGDLLSRNARKFPDKLSLVSENLSMNYRTLNERVNRLANSLIDAGLRKGDRIGALVHNSHQFFEIYFAAAKTGGIFCPYNNHLKESELRDVIGYSAPKFLFVDRDYGEMTNVLKPGLATVERYICLQAPEWPFMEYYEAVLARGDESEPNSPVSEDDALSIYFTAGTTGRPKGAVRTHRHLLSDAIAGVIELKVDYDEKVLITFPLYHVAGEDNIVRHTFMGNTFYLKREGGFDPVEILRYIEKEKITRCQMVPTMIHSLLQVPDIREFDLGSLRLILYAAAPMPVELLKRALAVFPCGFAQLYGQTESGPLTTVLKPEDHILNGSEEKQKRLASSGRPVVNYEIRIVNEHDQDVPVGDVGEIIARSEAMMKEYWLMTEETAKKLKNGWLHTGDLGRMDEEGYVYIVERKNDLIISGGVNIYPREVEEVLYRHPAISEASVVGIPDEHWGEVVKAVVVLSDGAQTTESEIKEFCGQHLAGYKKPKTVDFWKELPKSPQGKVLKKEIRAHYARQAKL